MMADELLNAQDLITAKKHDTFHSEVITGKVGGLSTGANIDYATNAVTGQVQKTLPKVIDDIDWSYVGKFADGVTFTKKTDFALDSVGTQWIYTGNYPFTATAGTAPSEPTYQVVHVKSASAISNANGGSVQDFIDASNALTIHSAILKSWTVGTVIQTAGYYDIGDGGGGRYVVRGSGFPIVMDEMGLIHHTDAIGNILELQFTDSLNYLQAGGKADWDRILLDGTDNTPILQNAINYLFPFEWKGTVAATNAEPKKFRCPIFVPAVSGKYMLSDVVKLNPLTSIIGPKVSRSFGMSIASSDTVGAFFVPNFLAGKSSKYIFDSAPYNSSGIRVFGSSLLLSNSDKDNGIYTPVDAITIENILICPDFSTNNEGAGDIHFSPLRLFGTSHRIKNNFFAQTLHGPSLEACWDYDYDGNLVQTFDSALAIYQGTVGNIGGINYCNKLGNRVRYGTTLPLWWPDEDSATFVAGDYDVPASLVVKDVVGGKVSIGTWIQEKYNRTLLGDNSSIYFDMLHSESIDKTLIAVKGCNVEFNAGKTFLPSNRLFRPVGRFGGGSKVSFSHFDFGCTGKLADYIESGVEINLLSGCIASNAQDGTVNQGIIQTTTYTIRNDGQGTPSVYYESLARRPVKELFVNVLTTGLKSDNYYGLDDNSALASLDEALSRIHSGDVVEIKLRNSSSSTTSQTFASVPLVKNANVTLSLRFNNRTHTITGYPLLIDSSYRVGSGIVITGAVAFQLEGVVNLSVTGNCIINTSGNMFTVGAGKASSLTLMKQDTASFNTTGSFSSDSSVMSVNYLNSSSSVSVPAGGWGALTKVI